MQVVLSVIAGPHQGTRFTFDAHDSFIVGRSDRAHLRLSQKDRYFSRVHFLIEVNPPMCRVVDLGSRNGTLVNDHKVQVADLHDGDRIKGGNTIFEVKFILENEKSPVTPDIAMTGSFAEVPLLSGGEKADNSVVTPAKTAKPLVIDGYRILKKLGQGGMGEVYLAIRKSDCQEVAIKTIRPIVQGSEREVERFLREASILQNLQHPNIVAFHDMGSAGELLFFTMDYVRGMDASSLLKREGPLPIRRAVDLVCQAIDGLQYAHSQGYVHRDVKPSNLLVSQAEGREICQLADFGLGRIYRSTKMSGLTMLDDVGGTVPFMAPEQITNFRGAKPPADQYAAAATLYRLLTAKYIFDFDGVPDQERFSIVLLKAPVDIRERRKDIPHKLAKAIHMALAKDAHNRYADVAAFGRILRQFADSGN